jgi:putative ABC transport system permease protein
MSGREQHREQCAPQPPRVAAGLVRAILPSHGAAACIADLDERFEAMVRRRGVRAARRWYRRQAAGFVTRVPLVRLVDAFRGSSPGGGNASRPASPSSPPSAPGGPRRLLASLGRDLRYAARALLARPGFTLPAVIILALAIAANSAVLGIVDKVMLRDLPIADAESVVMLWDVRPPDSDYPGPLPASFNHYRAWQSRDDIFEQIIAFETLQPAILTDDYPVRTHGMMVSGDTFELLGASPALGRPLRPSDDRPDADPVAVISDRLWRQAFDADEAIVGRVITVDNAPVTVVGVMPADFWFFDPYMFTRSIGDRDAAQPDVFRPLSTRDWTDEGWVDYGALRVMGRLRPGVSLQQAEAALAAMREARLLEGEEPRLGVDLVPLTDEVLGDLGPRLLLLQGAVTLLVLIACVNVMSLVLAKASAQRGELAVRAALGAGRASLLRLAVTESGLLGIAGGVLGLLGAHALGGLVLRIAPRELPLAHRVGVDGRIVLITLAVALLAGMIAGLLPALSLDFKSITRSLRSGSRSVAGSALGARSRFVLVVVEVALTLVLLVGATVMMRSFVGVWRTDPGFDARSALTFMSTLSTPPDEEPDFEFHTRLLDELRGVPGVQAVGATSHLPFSQWAYGRPVVVGDAPESLDEAPRVSARWITEDYLDAMGMRLLAGRDFERRDDVAGEPVVIINEAFARRFFGEQQSPEALVGEIVGVVTYGTPREIVAHRVVGVIGNVKHDRLFENERAIFYTPLRQTSIVYLRFVVRTAGDPLALVDRVRDIAANLAPSQPLTEMYTLERLIAESLTEERFYTQLLSAFGLVAFALAAIGVYGSVAYSVRLRMPEIGVRIAFGARPGAIRRLIVGRGLAPVAIGVVAGCGGAAVLVRGLASLLHDVAPLDPASFAAAAVLFAIAAAVAALIPACRAASVDPIEVLRSD